MKKLFLIIALVFIASCSQVQDFEYGAEQLDILNSRYDVTIETYPNNIGEIDLMLKDLEELENIQLQKDQEAFNYLIDYVRLNLEAERLLVENQKYGTSGSTKNGFGCKRRPLIIESADLRINSALKGFEAVSLLSEFVGQYPEEAASVGLSHKNALFLNATFIQISTDASRDDRVIKNFCSVSRVLELYQLDFRKKTDLDEDFINSLSYDGAVVIWKEKIYGFS